MSNRTADDLSPEDVSSRQHSGRDQRQRQHGGWSHALHAIGGRPLHQGDQAALRTARTGGPR